MKKEAKKQTKGVSKFVYWTPRIFSILFLLFLALFSLDVIEPGISFLQIYIGLLIHNIPVFILLILLLIANKKEIVGVYTFFIAGLIYLGFMICNAAVYGGEWYMISYSLIIAGPAFLIGYLFWLNWNRKKK
jgi:hypothetical protein